MAKNGTLLTRQHQLSPNAFKGKIYVMINGSFSASSLISSNLKTPKVTFVGEETGGAFNGTM
jgi:hypothetical protein